MFVAAGPLRCASGPGDPQSPSLDCVPLSTCPALEASAGRSHRQRRPGRIAGGGGVCLRWGMNSFGAVCEWGCEGSERPGLRSGSGNSESEAGSGPASPAIAGGPQPSAAKARNSLQSLPPFAGCAREPPIHPSPETPRRPPASREPPRPSPARAPSLPAARSPASREPPRRSAFREPLPPIRLPRPRAVHLPPEQRPRSFPSREPPLPSASRDPAPSTCLPSNGPVHFPPENRLADPSPETPRRPPASRATAPFISLPRTASPIRLPRTTPAHPPPETPRRPPASRATAPFISRPRTTPADPPPENRSRSPPPARPPHRFFHESWKPIPACAPYLCGVRPRRASPSFRKTKLGAAAAGSSTADRRTKLLPSAFPAARIESAAPGRDFPETHVSDRSARRSRGRVAGLAGPGHGDVRALGGAAQETAPFDRPRSPALSRK